MEYFPLVDEDGKVTGRAARAECHGNPELLHPVVHCIVFSSAGEWLLQKRSSDKDIQPGKWDTSVGGHVQFDEPIAQALVREVGEEIGVDITGMSPEFYHKYINSNSLESELVYTYAITFNGPFRAQDEEVDDLRFWSADDISAKLGSGIFTPNFEEEFRRVINRSDLK